MYAKASDIRKDLAEMIKAPNRMKVSDAVSQYMRVPLGGGSSVKWDKDRTPYVIEPMDCLNSREYDAVIFVGPARTGKTIGLIDGWITYSIICDPSDFLLVQLTQEKASEHSRKRLDRTFRCSPEILKRLSPRKNDNNVHDKYFRAGNLLKIGWPSINVLSSSDYKYVALTDYDRWPEDVDGEGDGFSLASKRTTTFMSSGMTLVESSPGKDIKDVKHRVGSTHEAPPTTGILSLYNRGDRRRFYWPCPSCKEYFEPSMANMVGYREDPDYVKASENARLQCPHCQTLIEPSLKRELNIKGVWLKEGQTIDKKGKIKGTGRSSRIIDRYNISHTLPDSDGVIEKIDPRIPDDWNILISDVLKKCYPLSNNPNHFMPILAMAVDSGGEEGVTDNAYKFWRKCRRDGYAKRVYLVKGDSTKRQKLITKTYPDNTTRSDRHSSARGDVPLYLLQTDYLKDRINNALARDTVGANYIHFPEWIGEWFFNELVYEERGADGKWRKPGKGNNEAFDLFCYAHAIAILRGYERIKWGDEKDVPSWAKLPDINPNIIREQTATAEPTVETEEKIAKVTPKQTKSKSSWLSGGGRKTGGWL
ncbi:hypothetical protein CBE90_10695 [Pasteurella multocida]|uniref:phage terminase large subunit family protein n=1 Tax=Pasteurella multocida TaxID=747 RepID=UPI000CE8F21F|nr:terminase gpA endonuclease subunit [Pasteurella multocida]PPE93748.1 hypothetical protein CBE90_10695 [Pasteurella multocida]PPE95017.1 hypothetical protein CBE91_10510 [Pasteurella multocida]